MGDHDDIRCAGDHGALGGDLITRVGAGSEFPVKAQTPMGPIQRRYWFDASTAGGAVVVIQR